MLDRQDAPEPATHLTADVTAVPTPEHVLRELADATAAAIDVDGVAVMRSHPDGTQQFIHATTRPLEWLERLQEALQNGPCRRAYTNAKVVICADLQVEVVDWEPLRTRALALGLRSVTAIPLVARDRVRGVLDLYRAVPRALNQQELTTCMSLANIAASTLAALPDQDTRTSGQFRAEHG